VICHAFGGKADIAPNRSHVLRYKNPLGLTGAAIFGVEWVEGEAS
jgi:hypothetical protein